MRYYLILLLLFFTANTWAQNAEQPIGSWREHLPYQSTIDITASPTKIYTATPFSIFSIDGATKEVTRISKVSGLSETGISTIHYDPLNQKLLIAYTNSNIDVVNANAIKNIPGLKRENIAGDKTIYHFYAKGNLAYLSTGLGVIVLDIDKYEIKDSWFIGNNGSYVKTHMFTTDASFYYAATDEGLKKTPINNPNPANFTTWQNVSGTNGLAQGAGKGVINIKNKIVAVVNDSLFVQTGTNWSLLFGNGWPIISTNLSNDKIIVSQRMSNGASQVIILNEAGIVERTLQQPGVISFPRKGIVHQSGIWVADQYNGLSQWTGNSFEQHKINSPEDIALGNLTVYNNTLYATAGAVNSSWNYQYNRAGVFKFSNGEWTNYNGFRFSQLDTLLDFITIAIDPRDESVWAGSYGGGLLHIKDGKFTIYKQLSPVGATIGDPASYRVSGLAFDQQNNLWITNYGASKYIHVLKNNGTWQSFTSPFSLYGNAVSQILVDDEGQKWIVAPMGDGLIVFNDNNTIDNTADDKWRIFKTGSGNGSLPSNTVLSIAKDRNGFIWVGTDNGVAVIQCPQQIFANGCEAILPIINEGSFANHLFKGEQVRSIAVDGADRKWIATANGVWLLSSEGEKVLANYTETNSSLLSNDVRSIAINGTTGEVFFATSKGISSLKGTATEPAETTENILIHPNPVPPGYGGTIGIKGLAPNSFVKITELNGRLVYQAKALGGQAVWNGKDNKGRNIMSGVYLVIAIDEMKQEKAVGKIVFISK